MKHPSSRAFFQYWDSKRGQAAAPDRGDFAPDAVRGLLGDIFVLSYDRATNHPFRVAGTRVCSLLGCDAKGQSFTGMFSSGSRTELEDLLGIVAEEMLPLVAGVTARAADGSSAQLELLLLPFNTKAHAPISLTGLLAPLHAMSGRMTDFNLNTWRYVMPQHNGPGRALRRWSNTPGFTIYEGMRQTPR